MQAVESARQGLRRFREDSFDLVITDQTMPAMTGADLAVKMLQIRSDTPIILCTGFSEKITLEKAKALGIRGFLNKPFSKRDLIAVINNMFKKSSEKAEVD